MRSRLVALCLFLLMFATAALGQSDRGTITGTVSDATGAVIPGVSVIATNTETGSRYETVSTETGNYTLVQLPAGVYELSAELPGFKKYVRQGITVLVAQTLRINVDLQVGANTESITVTGDAPLLRTGRARSLSGSIFKFRARRVISPFSDQRFCLPRSRCSPKTQFSLESQVGLRV